MNFFQQYTKEALRKVGQTMKNIIGESQKKYPAGEIRK